jgi:hypothetical protein
MVLQTKTIINIPKDGSMNGRLKATPQSQLIMLTTSSNQNNI